MKRSAGKRAARRESGGQGAPEATVQDSYYSRDELAAIGFKSLGERVLVSRKTSIYRPEAIALGSDLRIDDYCVLAGGVGIDLGNFVHIACFCGLFGGAGIVMEDFAGLSAHVLIYSTSDDYSGQSLTNPTVPERYKPGLRAAPVALGRHVIVGAHTTVLPGAVLAEGAAVGAHSLVNRNCEAWSIYAGVPAKKLGPRSRALLALEKELATSSPQGAMTAPGAGNGTNLP